MGKKRQFETDAIIVPVDGDNYAISFSVAKITIPGLGVIDTQKLVIEESKRLDVLNAEKRKKKKDNTLIDSLESQLIIPQLLESYIDTESNSSAFTYKLVD